MLNATQLEDARLFAPPPQQGNRGDLAQGDFLTLMITQFRNQDPFEPMDNGEFLGQLAQFSTVNGIDSLNTSFAGLEGALRDEQALQAANLVGRTVLANADSAYFDGETSLGGAIELGASASNVQVDITDSSGQLITRLILGEQPPGTLQFDWDGRADDGELVAAGHYQLDVRVSRGTITESVPAYIRADIESVTLSQFGGGMSLNLAGGDSLSLGDLYQII